MLKVGLHVDGSDKQNSLDCDSSTTSMHEIYGRGLNDKNQRRHRPRFHSRFNIRGEKSEDRKSSGENDDIRSEVICVHHRPRIALVP